MADHQRRNPGRHAAGGGLNNAPSPHDAGAHAEGLNAQPRPARATRQQAAARQTAGQRQGQHPAAQRPEQQLPESRRAAGQHVAAQRPAQADPRQQAQAPSRQRAAQAAVRRPTQASAQRQGQRASAQQPSQASRQRRPQASASAPRQAAHPAGASAVANPYRRSDDGSGYRPVQPGGKSAGKSKKGGPWRVVFWIALIVLVASLAVLGALLFSYWQGQNAYDKIADQAFEAPQDVEGAALEDLQVDWDALRAVNPDVVGWIYIPGTIVNYPIVHTDNDERYLTYDFNGEQGWGATFGTIFLQAANAGDFSDANNIVYGHHLNNGSMFACLADMQDDAGFNAHRTVYVLTPQGNYKLRTFSLVHCAADDPLAQTSFADSAAQTAYVQDKIDRSTAAPEGQLPAAEDIDHTFAFVTCDNLPSDGRYVLFSYVEDTTVAGQHAAGSDAVSADRQATEDAAQQAVSSASEELAAA